MGTAEHHPLITRNTHRHRRPCRARAGQRGLSLVELMVAMLIGLLLALVMVRALVFAEAQRRTTSASSDTDLSGAYAASVLDTALRSAGSGLMQSLDAGIIGCNPGFTGTLQPPFDNFLSGNPGNLRLAPLLIAAPPATPANNDAPISDVVAVMSASGAAGGIPRTVLSASGATLTLTNTVGITVSSQALISQSAGTCSIQNVQAVDSNSSHLTLAAEPAAPPSYLLPLGIAQDVQFQLFGVNPTTATLYSYDLLNHTLRPMASNVLAMQALYGIADGSGKLVQWVSPGATGYDIGSMMNDSAKLKQIVAVRIALILKSGLYEKDEKGENKSVSAGKKWYWFNPAPGTNADLSGIAYNADGLTVPQTWGPGAGTPAEHYRYSVIEFVVPMRNGMIINK